MQKTQYFSYKVGTLAKGCQLCVKGAKLVLFITGICPRRCYFCPISDKKYQKDVIYADEWPVKSPKDVMTEAKLINAKGAGITGGDPLCRLDRTIFYIKKLKKAFGRDFHIHLYTSLNLVKKNVLKKLHDAGLDEIRFHLDLEDDKLWNRICLAFDFGWDIGVEVPVIPGKERQLKRVIIFINEKNRTARKIKFLNLNELEVADNRVSKLSDMGYRPKNSLSYAIAGSESLAKKLLRFVENKRIKLDIHYCTATLKDRVQMANRIKRRAISVKKHYDTLTKDGTLIRGAIYLAELKPGISYRKKLSKILGSKRASYLNRLRRIKKELKKDFNISNMDIGIDTNKYRLLTSVKQVKKIRDIIEKDFMANIIKDKRLLNKKELYLAVVEEYPTYDQMELNVEFI